eukprot:624189_1
MKRFLGMVTFISDFISHMEQEQALLTSTTRKEHPETFVLTDTQRKTFNILKTKVQSAEYLMHPDVDWIADPNIDHNPFHVFTDASKYGIQQMPTQLACQRTRDLRHYQII